LCPFLHAAVKVISLPAFTCHVSAFVGAIFDGP
jgi:hypothetical protein